MVMSKEEKAKKQHERYLKQKESGMTKVYEKRRHAKHREKRNAACRAWHAKNKERGLEYAKERYRNDPEHRARVNAWSREYRKANKKTLSEKNKKWREENKDILKIKASAYYNNNKEKILEKRKAYRVSPSGKLVDKKYREKIRATTHGKLRHSISNGIRLKLINHGGKKNRSKIDDLLPFKISDLIIRLESMFKPDMSWDNYGEWHIDHIIPDSSFDYTTVNCPGFKKSWALENLQPLWASENCSKGAKIL